MTWAGMKEQPSMCDLLRASLLYAEHQGRREEILRHKWLESEKVGHDIGYDLACVDWTLKYCAQWRKAWQEKHLPSRFRL